jgi:hypothetical protein
MNVSRHTSSALPVSLSLLGNGSVKKKLIAEANIHATEKTLDTSFSMRSVSYQGKQAISFSDIQIITNTDINISMFVRIFVHTGVHSLRRCSTQFAAYSKYRIFSNLI